MEGASNVRWCIAGVLKTGIAGEFEKSSGKVISALHASTEETIIKMRTLVKAVLIL